MASHLSTPTLAVASTMSNLGLCISIASSENGDMEPGRILLKTVRTFKVGGAHADTGHVELERHGHELGSITASTETRGTPRRRRPGLDSSRLRKPSFGPKTATIVLMSPGIRSWSTSVDTGYRTVCNSRGYRSGSIALRGVGWQFALNNGSLTARGAAFVVQWLHDRRSSRGGDIMTEP